MHVLPSALTSVPFPAALASRESSSLRALEWAHGHRDGLAALVLGAVLDPAELEDGPRVHHEQREELVAGGLLAAASLVILPWLVTDSSAVESWFESLLRARSCVRAA
jgi:hypothetical protein